MSLLLGVDLGTSSLKTLLMDEDGNVRAGANRAYQFDTPYSGYAEQEPGVWWKAFKETLSEILATGQINPEEISALSFSGQMHGAVMLDENFCPVRPAILHCDARSGKQVRDLRERLGEERILSWMLNPVYAGFLLVSLIWVRENEPEVYSKIRHMCLPKDYLKYKLIGQLSSDYSDASATLAFDVKEIKWSKDILKILDIPKEFFPVCFETTEAVGTISQKAAKETGLSTRTRVVAGGGDQVMQGIGNGITHVGGVSINIGTSGQVSFQADRAVLNPDFSTNTFCGYKRGRWITMGAIMNAGLCINWVNRLLGQNDYKKVNAAVEKIQPGSEGVIFLPYLNGERTPHMNPDISGEFVGLNLKTGSAELTRSVMEGVTYALYQCLEICRGLDLEQIGTVISSGGGSRSLPWLHIQSDVFNLPIKVAENPEQACVGACIAAGVGAGLYHDIEEGCRRIVRYKEMMIEPNQRCHDIYMEYYRIFKAIYASGKKELMDVTLLGREVGRLGKIK